MAKTASLPTLFGRFTAASGEHERLAATLRELAAMCAALESGIRERAVDSTPFRLIADLRRNLERHFCAEEAEGYFGTVVQERPTLQAQIADLKAEHCVMLEETAKLAEISADEGRWSELALPTRRLIKRLRAHEHTESALMQQFFSRAED
jgi:hypothetical protein